MGPGAKCLSSSAWPFAATGVHVAGADDAPGAAVLGMLLMVAGVVLGLRAARHRLSMRPARTALAVGVAIAAVTAFSIHAACHRASLPPAAGRAVERRLGTLTATCGGRRAENLPGVSVAVGAGGALVWAEGLDGETRPEVG